MTVFIFKFFLIAISVMLIFFLVGLVFRHARKLDRRIKQFKKEVADAEKQGKPINPYAELSELYSEPEQNNSKTKK